MSKNINLSLYHFENQISHSHLQQENQVLYIRKLLSPPPPRSMPYCENLSFQHFKNKFLALTIAKKSLKTLTPKAPNG